MRLLRLELLLYEIWYQVSHRWIFWSWLKDAVAESYKLNNIEVNYEKIGIAIGKWSSY